MTENNKIKMSRDLYIFQHAKELSKTDEEKCLSKAIAALKEFVQKENCRFCPERCEDDEDDFYEEDAIVLYAEPGHTASLVEEEWAIDEMMIHGHVSSFKLHHITDELYAVFPKEIATFHSDGSVFVAGPMYICNSIIEEDGEEVTGDLSAVEFCEAMSYLATHTVNKSSSGKSGFLLDEEV